MNWKKLKLTLYRDFLQYKQMLVWTVCLDLAYLAFVLANNYYQFTDASFSFMGGFIFGLSLMCVMQICAMFMSKKTAIPFMMVPASNLEKLTSRVLLLGVLPMTLIAIVNGAATRESATLFAFQIDIEKNAENLERFHPENLSCTNLFTGQTYTYQNDTITEAFHGRFNDVVIDKYRDDSKIQVGINSSVLGDIMFVVGLIGIMIFLMIGIKNYIVASIVTIVTSILIVVGMVAGIYGVFYNSLSIATTENFILIASIVVGLIGIYLLWRAYKTLDNRQID